MEDLIGDYIKSCPQNVQEKLYQIRQIIEKAAPLAKQKISWRMPTYYQNGNLAHFASHKNHIGFYPGAEAIEKFKEELKNYVTSKGAVQFPYAKDLPEDLIIKIVKYRVSVQEKKE